MRLPNRPSWKKTNNPRKYVHFVFQDHHMGGFQNMIEKNSILYCMYGGISVEISVGKIKIHLSTVETQ